MAKWNSATCHEIEQLPSEEYEKDKNPPGQEDEDGFSEAANGGLDSLAFLESG